MRADGEAAAAAANVQRERVALDVARLEHRLEAVDLALEALDARLEAAPLLDEGLADVGRVLRHAEHHVLRAVREAQRRQRLIDEPVRRRHGRDEQVRELPPSDACSSRVSTESR